MTWVYQEGYRPLRVGKKRAFKDQVDLELGIEAARQLGPGAIVAISAVARRGARPARSHPGARRTDRHWSTRINDTSSRPSEWATGCRAEPLHKRALAITEKALGPDHPDVGIRLNNLAVLYRAQGRNAEAEPLHKRALAIAEKALGPDHPTVGLYLSNLAVLHGAQGRNAEAEPLHKRALAIVEKALGPDHPDVGLYLKNLAELYRAQGRTAEAGPLHKRALNCGRRHGRWSGTHTPCRVGAMMAFAFKPIPRCAGFRVTSRWRRSPGRRP